MDEVTTHFKADGMEALIAFGALILGFLIGVVGSFLTFLSNIREARAEKSTAYLGLETHSSAIFQFEAANAQAMAPFRRRVRPQKIPKNPDFESGRKIAEQLYFQSLNLFEVAANFRKQGIAAPEVFASWVAWFDELVCDWYFREFWDDIRNNYTPDVRAIFDIGLIVFKHPDFTEEERVKAFYMGVSHALGGCKVVETWLEQCENREEEQGWFSNYLNVRHTSA